MLRGHKLLKPPCYDDNEPGLVIGQILHFVQKHKAVFHASLNISRGRRRSAACLYASEQNRGCVQPPDPPGTRAWPCPAEAACLSRAGLGLWAGGRSEGSLDSAFSCQPAATRRTGPGQPTDMLPATPLSPGQTATSQRDQAEPGCRVIGPFKSKLSAAGNKTLPFNSGIIRSGLETSRGKAFIEKRWENEI